VDNNQHIQRKLAHIILNGLPEAGKSTLLDRLLKRPFREHFSTKISDGIVVVDINPTSTLSAAYANNDSTWESIDIDMSLSSQLGGSVTFLPESSGQQVEVCANVSIQERKDNSVVANNDVDISTGTISEIHDNVKKILRTHNIKSMEDLETKCSLYIRDTGGQVEFQECLSLLIYGPSIFIFVLRIDIDIYKKVTVQYRTPSGDVINRYQSSISTVDALLQFLTSVSAIQTTQEGIFQEEGTYLSHEPVVFIVGTHIDLLNSETASIDEINATLDKIICEQNFSDLVHYANDDCGKVMYLVDNTTNSDEEFQPLRRDINEYTERPEFTVDYPISYLLCCLELQEIQETVLSLDEFRQLALKFGISSNEMSHLLRFLHFRVGIIHYYDVDCLSDIIIKEPQFLFNKVTDLLVKTFISTGAMKTGQKKCFCQKGIVESSVIENIIRKSGDKITSQQFMAFLVHLRIAVPFTDQNGIKKYFIPCVLNHVPASSSDTKESDIAPLAICFHLDHCPKGLFGVLISHLLWPDDNREVSFDLLEDKIYQDQVSLRVYSPEDVDKITLKLHLSRIDINLFVENSSPALSSESLLASRKSTVSTVCANIRSTVQDSLQSSLKTLHYDSKKVKFRFSLKCPDDNCSLWHEVNCGEEQSYMHCQPSCSKFNLPKSGNVWFNNTGNYILTYSLTLA